MGRPKGSRVIFDEFTDMDISEAAKYQRRALKRNPDLARAKRRERQSTPRYIAARKIYMRDYHAKRKVSR